MDRKLEGNTGGVYYKHVFYISMSALAAVFFIVLFLTNGYSMRGLLFQTRDQTYMDFFNSMLYNINEPYENYVFYPPLATLMYKFLLMMVPQSTIDAVVFNRYATSFSADVKLYQQFYIPFIFYTVITGAALYFSLSASKKGSRGEKLLFIFLTLTSGPMLFMFERGNNIIIALILSLIFVTFYKSDKVLVRELSLIALSAAIAIKIYPIVFCALLVREKRIKELLRTALYSILLFVVPFFIFYDGLGSIKLLLANLSNYGNITNLSTGTQLNFAKMPILPLSLFDISNDMLLRIGDAFKVVVMFAAVLASFFVDREWKAAAVCCCIIYGYQSTCATYLLVMFCIPVILMLDSEKEHSPKSYVYISLMILSLGLIVSLNPVTGKFSRYIGTKISSYAIMILTFMLIYDGINGFCGWAAKITGLKKKTAVLFTALILSAVLANVLFIAPGSIFDLINIKFLTSSLIKNLLVCFTAAAVLIGAVFLVWFFRRRDEDDGLGLARQFLKFGLVGISNTLISLIVYYIFFFISPKLYFAGNVAGFVVSVFNAYYWNNKYVFKASGESRLKTILKTFAAYGATFILSSVLLVVMVELLGVPGLIAPVINLIITIPLNFILNKLWAFGDNRNTFKDVFTRLKSGFIKTGAKNSKEEKSTENNEAAAADKERR